MQKAYITAAASILTVESRHSAYIRNTQHESPFAQPFDAPLGLNQVYTLAAPFIVTCPAANGKLPVMAFPSLSVSCPGSEIKTNATVQLVSKSNFPEGKTLYAAWYAVTGPTFTPTTWNGQNTLVTKVPPGFHGQSYVVITTNNTVATDDYVVAGPAIVEIKGASGTESK